MNCEECKDLIAISVFGELTPDVQAQLQDHLRDCAGCRAAYERSEKLKTMDTQNDTITIPDKEKSWEIISAKALKKKRRWFEIFPVTKPVYQYAAALLLLMVGFSVGYFLRAEGLKGSQLAQLHEEITQIREFTAASLLRQESLNAKLGNLSLNASITRSDERPLEFLYRTLVSSREESGVETQGGQTSPLVDIALTLVRQINKSEIY